MLSLSNLPTTIPNAKINMRAVIIMLNGKNEIVLVGTKEGKWSLPGGKFEAKNGDLLQTAIREALEETGCFGMFQYFLCATVDVARSKTNYNAVAVFQFQEQGPPSEDPTRKVGWFSLEQTICELSQSEEQSKRNQIRIVRRLQKQLAALKIRKDEFGEFDSATNCGLDQMNRFFSEFEIIDRPISSILAISGGTSKRALFPGQCFEKQSLQARPEMTISNFENGQHYTFMILAFFGTVLDESQHFHSLRLLHGNIRSNFDGIELVSYAGPLGVSHQKWLLMVIKHSDQICSAKLKEYNTDAFFDKDYKFGSLVENFVIDQSLETVRRKNWDFRRFLNEQSATVISANVFDVVDG